MNNLKNMNEFFKSNKYLLLWLAVSLAAAAGFTAAFFATGGRSHLFFIPQVGFTLLFLVLLRILLGRLVKGGLFVPFRRTRRLLGGIGSLLFRFASGITNAVKAKVSGIFARFIPQGRSAKALVLRHFKDERSSAYIERRSSRPRFRKLKWKNLTTNQERIRFIYIAFLERQIKKGAAYSTTDTPNELYIKLRMKNSGLSDRLFGLYNRARYQVTRTAEGYGNDDTADTGISAQDVQDVLPYSTGKMP